MSPADEGPSLGLVGAARLSGVVHCSHSGMGAGVGGWGESPQPPLSLAGHCGDRQPCWHWHRSWDLALTTAPRMSFQHSPARGGWGLQQGGEQAGGRYSPYLCNPLKEG